MRILRVPIQFTVRGWKITTDRVEKAAAGNSTLPLATLLSVDTACADRREDLFAQRLEKAISRIRGINDCHFGRQLVGQIEQLFASRYGHQDLLCTFVGRKFDDTDSIVNWLYRPSQI